MGEIRSSRHFFLVLNLIAIAALPSFADAKDLKIISAGSVRSVFKKFVPAYQAQTQSHVDTTFASSGRLKEVLQSGEEGDLIIAANALLDELTTSSRIIPDSRKQLGRVCFGTVLRDGFRTGDVSTIDGLKQALMDANTVAFTDPALQGATYLHLMTIAKQFGLADAVNAKGVFATGGDDAAQKVASGKADLAIMFHSEIIAGGARLAAMLPQSLQLCAAYSAAVPSKSRDPVEAQNFLDMLTGASTRSIWRESGWDVTGE
jgi:molybdate transport system substrate-binding protein